MPRISNFHCKFNRLLACQKHYFSFFFVLLLSIGIIILCKAIRRDKSGLKLLLLCMIQSGRLPSVDLYEVPISVPFPFSILVGKGIPHPSNSTPPIICQGLVKGDSAQIIVTSNVKLSQKSQNYRGVIASIKNFKACCWRTYCSTSSPSTPSCIHLILTLSCARPPAARRNILQRQLWFVPSPFTNLDYCSSHFWIWRRPLGAVTGEVNI